MFFRRVPLEVDVETTYVTFVRFEYDPAYATSGDAIAARRGDVSDFLFEGVRRRPSTGGSADVKHKTIDFRRP